VTPVAGFMEERGGQHELISDVFHQLSQPLTALQCSLELALIRDRTSEEYRTSVQAALQNAERLRQSLLLLRELSDADDPGDISAPVDLQRLLFDLREDFLPVFESAGARFNLVCNAVHVRGNGAKLMRAFFYLLEHLLHAPSPTCLEIDVETNSQQAEIRMTVSRAEPDVVPPDEPIEPISEGQLKIARRTFRAAGGDLVLAESAARRSVWVASLRLSGPCPG